MDMKGPSRGRYYICLILCSMHVVKENGDQPSRSLPVALVFVIDFIACSSARTDDRRGVNLFPLLCLRESEK